MSRTHKRVFKAGKKVPARFPREYASRKKKGSLPKSFFTGKYRQNPYRQVWYKGRSQGMHRVRWQKKHGDIPKGYILHHKNGNNSDHRLNNLQLMKHNDHARISGSERPNTYERQYED